MEKYNQGQAYTPADDAKVPAHDGIYCGDTAGTITVKFTEQGSAVSFDFVAGAFLPIEVYSIQNTNTDPTSVILLRKV